MLHVELSSGRQNEFDPLPTFVLVREEYDELITGLLGKK